MEIEGQIIITQPLVIEGEADIAQPLVLTGLVVVSGSGGGGGGTTDYNDLSNKPSINGTTLSGNKTSHQLGVADENHTHTVAQITDFPTLAAVATSGSYTDLSDTPTIPDAQIQSDWNQSDNTKKDYIKNKPTIPVVTGKADKVSGATNGNFAGLDSNGNLTDSGSKASDFQTTINSSNKLSADYIIDGTTNKVINVKPNWNAAAGNAAEILNKPTIPDAVSGTNDGTNWTSLTIGSVTKNIPSGGGGGLTNYNFTHVANTTVSTSTTITFAANTRGSQMVSTSADLAVTFAVNNGSDNYLWIKNTGAADIDITISAVTAGGSPVANIYIPTDGITVAAGMVCEIGIIVNADGAFITSRSDLAL